MTEISCYTYSSSTFYVIIEPSVIEDGQLRMPDRFVQEHGNDLLDTVRLIVPTDDSWCVGLKKAGKMIWLHDGWQEFMEHHSIHCWYFLLFKYGHNSCFNIHIFDLAATEIHYRLRDHGNAKLQRCCETRSRANKLHDEPLMGKSVQQNMDTSVYSAVLAGGVTKHENDQEGNKNDILQLNESKHTESSKAFGQVSSKRTNCNKDRRKSTGQQLEKSVRRGRPPKRGRPLAAEAKRTIDAEKLSMPKDPYFMQSHYRLRSHGNAKLHDINQDHSHGKEKAVSNNDDESSVEIVHHLETEQGPESSPQSSELLHGAKRRKISPGRIKGRHYETRSNAKELPVSLNRINCKNDTCKSYTSQQLEKSVRHGRPHKRGRLWAAEANRAISAAKMFIPENPYFTKILLEYNIVRAYILNISTEFVRQYMPKTSKVIELQDCDGNKWNVRCNRRKDQISFGKGWSNFVRDTSLVAGDVCVFELISDIQTDEHVLKVHIFHSGVEESSTILHTGSLTEPTLPVSKTCILQFSESKDTESNDASGPLFSNKTNCKTDTGRSFTSQQLEKSVWRGRPPKRGRPLGAEANRAINSAKMFMPNDSYSMQFHYRLRSHGNARLHHISQDLLDGKKIGGDNDGKTSVEIVDPLKTEQGPESSVKSSELFHGDKKRKVAPERCKIWRCYETRSKANRLHDMRQVLNAKNLNIVGDSSLTKPLLGKLVQQNMDTSTYSAVVAGGVPNQDNAREGSKNDVLQFNESKQTESSDEFGPVSSNRTNCNDTSKPFTVKQLEKSVKCGGTHKREQPWAAEANRAINAAKMFMPKNPSFTAILAKYNVVRHYILNVPATFVRHYIPKTSKVIILQDSDGNKWHVCCAWRKDHLVSLSKGWLNFVRDNSLEVGDVCVFELIKDLQADELMLMVHIFRARVEQTSTTSIDTLVAYLNQLSISK